MMAAIIQASGTVEEIIALARTLEMGRDAERSGLTPTERDAVNSDAIILAIKSYRERTGVGLKEAKDFVEATAEGRAYLIRSEKRR
jgi:ribosomal protein L7/L12